jgi:hypothetical protein|nr:MAG TPA_asm: hypothetical protein [Caudoviricetes sp.]
MFLYSIGAMLDILLDLLVGPLTALPFTPSTPIPYIAFNASFLLSTSC